MIVRISTAQSRRLIAGVSIFVALWLAFFSIRTAIAAHEVGLGDLRGYERAVRLEPRNAFYWYLLGRYFQYNLDAFDPGKAIQAYQKSLALEPRSAEALMDLASVYDGEGDSQNAERYFVDAKRAYPASAETRWRYGNFLLREGRIPDAYRELHQAVVADPSFGPEAFSRCWRVNPDAEAIADQVLTPRPEIYVEVVHQLAGQGLLDPALQIWQRLVALHPTLPSWNLFRLSQALITAGRPAEAHQVWLQAGNMLATPVDPDPPSIVWDGGFESDVTGYGFTWNPKTDQSGYRISFDSQQKHSGKQSLRVIFDGTKNVNMSDACQLLLVEPGKTYQVSGWILTNGITKDEGLRLAISANRSATPSGGITEDVRGTQNWTLVQTHWTSPSDSQLADLCLVRRAGGEGDGTIAGAAWIDDVKVTPTTTGNPEQ